MQINTCSVSTNSSSIWAIRARNVPYVRVRVYIRHTYGKLHRLQSSFLTDSLLAKSHFTSTYLTCDAWVFVVLVLGNHIASASDDFCPIRNVPLQWRLFDGSTNQIWSADDFCSCRFLVCDCSEHRMESSIITLRRMTQKHWRHHNLHVHPLWLALFECTSRHPTESWIQGTIFCAYAHHHVRGLSGSTWRQTDKF